MAGFASNDQIINALSLGQKFDASFGKNFNPTAAAVANEWHMMARGAGNPAADAIFDAGANLTFIPVEDTTASAGCLQHGGNVQASGFLKFLLSGHVVSAAATVVPATVAILDVIGYYRVTSVTTATAQATTNTISTRTATFTADDTTDIMTYTSVTSLPSNLLTGTRVRVSTTTTLPAPLAAATDYYLIRLTDGTYKLATTYANAIAGTAINITTTGTGTHTLNWLLPRYTNGAGVNAIIFNPAATAMGAAVPNLSLGYTNSAQATSRATPTVLPIGKTAASNSHILYTGATGTGKYNYMMPLQSGDSGIAEINTIQNSISYVSGTYTVALVKEIGRFPLSTLGLASERNFLFEYPSMPRIYDGAALYFALGSGVATPASSAISGMLTFIYG
jgi:hypothetical protein